MLKMSNKNKPGGSAALLQEKIRISHVRYMLDQYFVLYAGAWKQIYCNITLYSKAMD